MLMEGKAGLVTGAAGALGAAIALGLAQEGASVVVADLALARDRGEEVVKRVRDVGGQGTFVAMDVTRASDADRLVAAVIEAFGSLDFACNNAGIAVTGRIGDTSEEDFDRLVAVNLKGVWLGMRSQLRAMTSAGVGSIVNTASLTGLVAMPMTGVYGATKHGVVGLTKSAAVEYADRGIRVNCVCPGMIRTPLLESLPPGGIEAGAAVQAIKRPAEPAEIADAIVWLCSEKASFTTGSVMTVDGGATAFA
jgi:NAD(P)-dependent dehydrogenase (short-subunit alcohol dehydrogenase family)